MRRSRQLISGSLNYPAPTPRDPSCARPKETRARCGPSTGPAAVSSRPGGARADGFGTRLSPGAQLGGAVHERDRSGLAG
jgi:hypothetical protein